MTDKIIEKIKILINENISKYLPDISKENLEEDGTIYYMNGKNGTEFDWYVNEKISDFFVFYNDSENLGAVKMTVYCDGYTIIYIYDENGHHLKQEVETDIHISEEELFHFAVLLKNTMDENLIWDKSIDQIDSDYQITAEQIHEFKENEKHYQGMIERKKMFGMSCYVSKRLLEEGWKVGYMVRDEAENEMDSGWSFMVGNEEKEYLDDYRNIAILHVADICQIDYNVLEHICKPVGTELIRVSSDEFEEDNHDKPVFLEKRG